jgi:uncharacterized protein YlaI
MIIISKKQMVDTHKMSSGYLRFAAIRNRMKNDCKYRNLAPTNMSVRAISISDKYEKK